MEITPDIHIYYIRQVSFGSSTIDQEHPTNTSKFSVDFYATPVKWCPLVEKEID